MICPICEGTGVNIYFSGYGRLCKCQRETTQNLPKADAYSLLADVREIITAIDIYQDNLKMFDFEKLSRQTRDDLNNIVEMKIKLSEHFS